MEKESSTISRSSDVETSFDFLFIFHVTFPMFGDVLNKSTCVSDSTVALHGSRNRSPQLLKANFQQAFDSSNISNFEPFDHAVTNSSEEGTLPVPCVVSTDFFSTKHLRNIISTC